MYLSPPGLTPPSTPIVLMLVSNNSITGNPQPVSAKSSYVSASSITHIGFLFVPLFTSDAGINLLLSYLKYIVPAFTVSHPLTVNVIVINLVPLYVSIVSVSGSKS